MKAKMTISLASLLVAAGLLVAGCGSSSSTDTSGEVNSGGGAGAPTESVEAGGEAGPSEAQSAATGDIPDNQVFLVFHDSRAGYSIRYPEGWARKGSANDVIFQEKANTVHCRRPQRCRPGQAGRQIHLHRPQRPRPGHRQAAAADDRPLRIRHRAARSQWSTWSPR